VFRGFYFFDRRLVDEGFAVAFEGELGGLVAGRTAALSRGGAETVARKPLKRLTFGRWARNTPLKQGVNEIWGELDKAEMRPRSPSFGFLAEPATGVGRGKSTARCSSRAEPPGT